MNQSLYESFTVYEPFGTGLPATWNSEILNKFQDISNNISSINTHMDKIDSIRADNGFQDYYENPNQKVTTSDALKHDMEYMMAQQQNTYAIGMVSIATLIIATGYIVGKYS
jgi:hypothetical protein